MIYYIKLRDDIDPISEWVAKHLLYRLKGVYGLEGREIGNGRGMDSEQRSHLRDVDKSYKEELQGRSIPFGEGEDWEAEDEPSERRITSLPETAIGKPE